MPRFLKRLIGSILTLATSLVVLAISAYAVPTHEYFDKSVSFDSDTLLPEDFFGFEIGDWHLSPEGLHAYMGELAAQSDKVAIETIGYSHERRALKHVYISSPENIANLDDVLARHRNAKSADEDILVINLSYSIHGNEASGSNTAPLMAYYLAANTDPEIEAILEKTVIIIEPSLNPDGMARFATWVNTHQGATPNYDNNHREHHEEFPNGRTNHYGFDLNRDWIFTVHPESKARIAAFQKWRPHLLGDYHEMGGNHPSYFFQPGHPKRTHPLTPPENQELTRGLAAFHGRALDKRAQPYFTEERFDDFYYGKGSTYTDAAGSIGILFEQSSVRGHRRDMAGTPMAFSDGIANHLATSLSMVEGSNAMRDELLAYRFNYIDWQTKQAEKDKVKAFVFGDDGDPARAQKLLDILARHKIDVYALQSDQRIDGQVFRTGSAWAVKLDPSQYALIRSLFETRKSFEDTVFYDVSTWNLPLAMNLPYAPMRSTAALSAKPLSKSALKAKTNDLPPKSLAYAIDWNQYGAPKLLGAFLNAGIYPRVSTLPVTAETNDEDSTDFAMGTIIVQPKNDKAHRKMRKIMARHPDIKVRGLVSGLTSSGPDFGSNLMPVLAPVKAALLYGEGVRVTEAAGIRYAVDMNFRQPLTLLDFDQAVRVDLSDYTHILIADGFYSAHKNLAEDLQTFVRGGGIIIAQKSGASWVENAVLELQKEEPSKPETGKDGPVRRAYLDYEQARGKSIVGDTCCTSR